MDPLNFTLGFAVGCLFTVVCLSIAAYRFMAPHMKQVSQRRHFDK